MYIRLCNFQQKRFSAPFNACSPCSYIKCKITMTMKCHYYSWDILLFPFLFLIQISYPGSAKVSVRGRLAIDFYPSKYLPGQPGWIQRHLWNYLTGSSKSSCDSLLSVFQTHLSLLLKLRPLDQHRHHHLGGFGNWAPVHTEGIWTCLLIRCLANIYACIM